MDKALINTRKPNPRTQKNIFSAIIFLFTLPIFKKGWREGLNEDDVYEVVPSFGSEKLGNRLESIWERECINNERPSVMRVILKCYAKRYLILGLVQLCVRMAVINIEPYALSEFLGCFSKPNFERNDAFLYGGILILLRFCNTIYAHNYMNLLMEFGIRVRTAFCSLLYRKALNLDPSSISDISTGKVVTLITKDVFAFDSAFTFINDMWIGLVQTVVVSYLIYQKIGSPVFAGIGFFLSLIPVQLWIGQKTKQYRLKTSKLTDERVQQAQESLSAIKIIKMYAWEKFFQKNIDEARENEMRLMRKVYYSKVLSIILGSLCSKISLYISLMVYVMIGNNITATLLYFVITCFQNLNSYITTSIPFGISQSAELFASVNRIGEVLRATEVKQTKRNITSQPQVILKNVSVQFNDKKVLKQVSLDVSKGLIIITGSVGSGKSTLLRTILKDYPISEGMMAVEGSISYASQEPWLFPSTIRQNILFGQHFNRTRYEEVLKVCGLNLDLNVLPHGDEEIVGDQGVNLSKGQQARIALARAVYKDSDIYLLDDCLTCLDSRVNKYVFRECLLEFLKNKIVIYVTNNTNHIQLCQEVFMLESGQLRHYDGKAFNKRVTYYVDEDEDDAEPDEEEQDILIVKEADFKKVYEEAIKQGTVKGEVYKKYLQFYGGLCTVILVFIIFLVTQYIQIRTDQLLNVWVNLEEKILHANETTKPALEETRDYQRILYTGLILGSAMFAFIRAFLHFYFTSKACIRLHRTMVDTIFYTFMEFFDSTRLGQIINRFSKDLSSIDEYLPLILYENMRISIFLAGILFLIVKTNLVFIIPTGILLVVLFFIRNYYIPTGRSLRRLDASTRSPMVGYLNTTLVGLTTIRAYGTQKILKKEFDRHQDVYTSTYYMSQTTLRAFGFTLDMLSNFFIASLIIWYILAADDALAGNVGLVLTQAFMLTGLLQWAVRQWSELESQMTSTERVLEYTSLKKEPQGGTELKDWPKQASIRFENVSLTYKTNNTISLKGISFEIPARQKVGIVGRTGSGKTSIISCLFRLYDFAGKIFLDNIDITTISLKKLRKAIAIIPQDPILFTGTIRANIDPTGSFSDAEIWKAIETVKLKKFIPNLQVIINEGGVNYSSGQKQLICLARALVTKNKLIVLDEATANMDPETDRLLHTAIKEHFSDCTILTVAHRLNSVLEADKVMVVNDGEIVQFGEPSTLLKEKEGLFYSMVRKAGIPIPENEDYL